MEEREERNSYDNVYPRWQNLCGLLTLIVLLGISMYGVYQTDNKYGKHVTYCYEHHIDKDLFYSAFDSLKRENDSLKQIIEEQRNTNIHQSVAKTKRQIEDKSREYFFKFIDLISRDHVSSNTQHIYIHTDK